MPNYIYSPEPHISEEAIKRLHHFSVQKQRKFKIRGIAGETKSIFFHFEGWRYEIEHPHIVRVSQRKSREILVIDFERDNTTELSKRMLEIIHKFLKV